MKYIELHIHLDGSIRLNTLYELSKTTESIELFSRKVSMAGRQSFSSLTDCLSVFSNILSIISGDEKILERIGYEFVEDQYNNNVLYTEVRYCPHLLRGNALSNIQVIDSINRGIKKGLSKYPIYINTILCAIREFPQWTPDIVDLAILYKDKGIVGIDLAGDEIQFNNELYIKDFKRAYDNGINITIHSGETGNEINIKTAIENLHATRIGHGYASIKNKEILNFIKNQNIHLECCPSSSLGTKSLTSLCPIKEFWNENLNYSINSDDPSVFGIKYKDEIDILQKDIGIDEKEIKRCMINSIKSAFTTQEVKDKIIKILNNIC